MAEGGRRMDDGRKRAMRFVIPHFSEPVLRPLVASGAAEGG